MGKKNKQNPTLGRALVKERFGKKKQFSNSIRHTTELQDGQEWGRLNLQSVTEQTNIDDFLSTAELAGTEFQAEKMNINFVPKNTLVGLLTEDQKITVKKAQELNKKFLRIPRRPPWNAQTTAEELALAERTSFLEWRRGLVELQSVEGITLTPFEKNLEFWRQLWRVIERSDVVAQIVDARNPLMFRCEDLENYVHEISKEKDNLLIINKSDFLTEKQRETWAFYFTKNDINFVFFSALEAEALNKIVEEEEKSTTDCDESWSSEKSEELDQVDEDCAIEEIRNDLKHLNTKAYEHTEDLNPLTEPQTTYLCSNKLLNRIELIEVFKTMHSKRKVSDRHVTIGLVGYPNVGKSSTINSIMKEKKTSVSATPGKTKHFQTLYLSDDIMLCDCPGLVFPAFVSTKPEMVVSGILPIDQMRDHVGPINTVASLIPRQVLEDIYGIAIPKPQEGEDPNRPPSSEELLGVYGFMRGFMTSRGIPDHPRSARYILKDYMNGKLLYCHCPPGEEQLVFHPFDLIKKRSQHKQTPQMMKAVPDIKRADVIDESFFATRSHVKGIQKIGGYYKNPSGSTSDLTQVPHKPWKKHNNRNKREKGRRKYAYLDQ